MTPDTKPLRGPTVGFGDGLGRAAVEGGFAVETAPLEDAVGGALSLVATPPGLQDFPARSGLVPDAMLVAVVLEAGLLTSDLTDKRSSSDISP